jgi:hypothetical protein
MSHQIVCAKPSYFPLDASAPQTEINYLVFELFVEFHLAVP